jgi:hypothetical protein
MKKPAANDRQAAWTKRYGELLKEFIAALGGESITPTMRATAKVLATLQTELSLLSDRFATTGRGASADDLSLFLKLAEKVADLLESIGLGPKPQSHSADDCDAPPKLDAILTGIIRARHEEEAQGVFRDAEGNFITDPDRLSIERQIYALKQKRDGAQPAVALLAPPSPSPPPPPAAPAPNVARIREDAQMPDDGPQKTSTQLFYESFADGSSSNYWGPV